MKRQYYICDYTYPTNNTDIFADDFVYFIGIVYYTIEKMKDKKKLKIFFKYISDNKQKIYHLNKILEEVEYPIDEDISYIINDGLIYGPNTLKNCKEKIKEILEKKYLEIYTKKFNI